MQPEKPKPAQKAPVSCLQFGNIVDVPHFSCDVNGPMSVLEAFIAGLSTHFWGVDVEPVNTELTHGAPDEDYTNAEDR